MKTRTITILFLSGMLTFSTSITSQINVLNRVKRAVGDRVSNQIDKAINKQLDTLEKKVTEKEIEKIEKTVETKKTENKETLPKQTIKTGTSTLITNVKGKGKYTLKSAIVEYKTTTMGIESVQKLYFDNYGEKEAYETLMKIMGFSNHTISITGDEFVYNIDLVKRTGTKSGTSDYPSNLNFEKLSKEIQEDITIKVEGKETFLDRECIKYSMTSTKLNMNGFYWVWKGIALKSDINFSAAKMMLEAVKVDENAAIPNEKFEIPGDINFEE